VERWKLYGSSKALVIGIDEYNNGWPHLSMAVRDAEEIATALEHRGFEVTLLKNLGSAELRSALRRFYLLQGNDPEARLFVWFAGHGHTENGEGYIVPADAPPPSSPEFVFDAIHMGDLASMQRVAQSKHVLTIFDSCFAGTVFSQQRAAPPAAITNAVKSPVRQFLTSGDADQTVSDDGTFRKLFLSAIDGDGSADANGDGYITATELGFNISSRLTNLTRGAQTPRNGKLRDIKFDRGDFVFMLPEKRATAHLASLPANVEPPRSSGTNDTTIELAFWNSVKDSQRASSFRAYLETYPNGHFVSLARERLANQTTTRRYFRNPGRERDLPPLPLSPAAAELVQKIQAYIDKNKAQVTGELKTVIERAINHEITGLNNCASIEMRSHSVLGQRDDGILMEFELAEFAGSAAFACGYNFPTRTVLLDWDGTVAKPLEVVPEQ